MKRSVEALDSMSDSEVIWAEVIEPHFEFSGSRNISGHYRRLFNDFFYSPYFNLELITESEPEILSDGQINDFYDFSDSEPELEALEEGDFDVSNLLEAFQRYLHDLSPVKARVFDQVMQGVYIEGSLFFDRKDDFYDESFDSLSAYNQEGIKMLRLEIHDREKYGCNATTFNLIVQHLKALAQKVDSDYGESPDQFDWWAEVPSQFSTLTIGERGISTPEDYRTLFRAGLTDHQQLFVDYIDDPFVRSCILESLELNAEDQEDEEPIDARISYQMVRVKWYLDEYEMPPSNQDVVFKFLLKMELDYRDKTRKKELSQQDPTRREAHFSHFLRVLRIGLGLVDSVRKRQYLLKEPLVDMFDDLFVDAAKTKVDQEELLIYCFELLTHDLEEDSKLTGVKSKEDTREYVGEVFPLQFPNKDRLLNTVADTAHGLNDDFFPGNREGYVKNALANPRLRRVKLPDMLQNFSSPYTDNAEKISVYGDVFLKPFQKAGLYYVVPDRLFISGLAQNPVLTAASETWRRIFAAISTKHQNQDMEVLARKADIPLAQDLT